ncbi:hypothetical protein [Pseudoalteromonas luteoviolacea]|uniref:hypothetical protein n=1 Tax=Pseudoalteromonas luteoviolacea TaxID=43657 RepID=UPI00068B6C94|nr:hypothetical protein [Pseudoalteromonas luteoviolacea]
MKGNILATLTVLSLLLLQGCAHTSNYAAKSTLNSSSEAGEKLEKSKILLMPIDVELAELTALGALETKADWTESAKKHMNVAAARVMEKHNADIVPFESDNTDPNAISYQLAKLHEAVGYSVLVHHLGPQKLPSKGKNFDWTLGNDAQTLRQETGADYALFLFMRDSYASAGRVAMQVLLGAPGGSQIGFASLVDLESGDVVWFNRLFSTTGDLRKEKSAQRSVQNLLDGFPSAE